MSISIVIPVLNEAADIEATLVQLSALRGPTVEVIVSDGGSDDDTQALCRPWSDVVVSAPAGRGIQMNAGAAVARGSVLVFLHADTQLCASHLTAIRAAMEDQSNTWGRFDIRLSGGVRALRVIEMMVNFRSRMTGVATGDQVMFMRRSTFNLLGGFPMIALMEDVAMSKRLRATAWPCCIRTPRVVTSSRRWEHNGIVRTVFLMWCLRAAYVLGASPERLKRFYRNHAR